MNDMCFNEEGCKPKCKTMPVVIPPANSAGKRKHMHETLFITFGASLPQAAHVLDLPPKPRKTTKEALTNGSGSD